MTDVLQLRFQCDADLAGNDDNKHSQTSFLGYLGGSLICWCSTEQGSVSTSTAESEIKAETIELSKYREILFIVKKRKFKYFRFLFKKF